MRGKVNEGVDKMSNGIFFVRIFFMGGFFLIFLFGFYRIANIVEHIVEVEEKLIDNYTWRPYYILFSNYSCLK